MAILNTAVNALEKLDTIVPAIQDMGRRHADYGVNDEHYDMVRAALIWTLGQGLKDDFNVETQAAWIAVYTLDADTMKAAAAEEVTA